METIAFFVLAGLAVISSWMVVSHRNPVVCAIALAGNLLSVAGFYFLLRAQFLALLQILVYAGAIMVLILFVIMLLDLKVEKTAFASGLFQRLVGPLLAAAFFAILGWVLYSGPADGSSTSLPGDYGTVSSVGMELFRDYFYPFEVISLLLVVAMVGAVMLAKRRL